jgi:hypothetical protein
LRLAEGSPTGVVTVSLWRPGLAQSVLPPSYRDRVEVLAYAGRPLRAGGIAAAAGLSTGKSTVEGLRSKLKRLAGRARLAGRGRPRAVHGAPPRRARCITPPA